MFHSDLWEDIQNDDGFYPITPKGVWELGKELYNAHQEGGMQGVEAYTTARYLEKGDQLVDIPFITVDDNYSVDDFTSDVAETIEEFEEGLDFVGDAFRDIYTEVLAGYGALFASILNYFLRPKIDDMARPPQALPDVDTLFVPSLTADVGFGHFNMMDFPSVTCVIEPSFTIFKDISTMCSILDTGMLSLNDRTNAAGSTLFAWKGGNPRFGAWS